MTSSAIVSSITRVEVGSSAEHGSSISSTRGRTASDAGDAQPLLLAAGQRAAGLAQPVADLLPQPGLGQALLDQVVLWRPGSTLTPVSFRPASTLS